MAPKPRQRQARVLGQVLPPSPGKAPALLTPSSQTPSLQLRDDIFLLVKPLHALKLVVVPCEQPSKLTQPVFVDAPGCLGLESTLIVHYSPGILQGGEHRNEKQGIHSVSPSGQKGHNVISELNCHLERWILGLAERRGF